MKINLNKVAWLAVIASLTAPAYALKPADEAIIELYQRVEDLQHDVNSLRGTNEQLRHELDTVKKSQKENAIAIDDRIQSVEDKVKTLTTEKPSAETTAKDTSASDSTSSSTEKPTEEKNVGETRKVKDSVAYKRAYDLLKDDPAGAVADFKDFLKDYPSSALAANAHYWIGETFYSQEKYEEAKKKFLTILKDYKGSNKEPDAALKLGYTFVQLKEWDYAKKTLQDVIKFFPGTREADLAEKKLATIKTK